VSDGVLALNAGSSTLKFGAYRFEQGRPEQLVSETLRAQPPLEAALEAALTKTRSALGAEPTVVGHRVVHGGSTFLAPVRLDSAVLEQLQALTPLAPLHLPPALALIRAAIARLPDARHVACFDTAFHGTLPDVARRFALPAALFEQGIRRYGFHGLSYEYVLSTFQGAPPRRLVVAHLGSGASMAAILDGRCIDTSMGLTPAGGLPMGTRSGDLDPGVIVYLLRQHGYSADELERLLDRESGLKGLAGTADVRELLARAEALEPRACAALQSFAYAVKKQLGAYVAALGGLDCLVFTGGIGEHAPQVRELVLRDLSALGLELDLARNRANSAVISADDSRCTIRVVAAQEELMIARHARALRDPA
jgi:acetate kinase